MDFYAIEDHLVQSYTRQQAMADRMLVDISEAATKVGFRAPVAMTKMHGPIVCGGIKLQQTRK